MNGRRDGEPGEPSEFYVLDSNGTGAAVGGGDGALTGSPGCNGGSRPGLRPAPRLTGSRRWAALGVGAVLIFGLGVAVGARVGAGSAAAGSAPASGNTGVASSPPVQTVRRTEALVTAASSPALSPPQSLQTDIYSLGPTSEPAEQWSMAPGACGQSEPGPRLSGATPLKALTGLTILAGEGLRPVSVDTGTVGEPLFGPDPHRFVVGATQDAGGVVVVVAPCDPSAPDLVIRRDASGKVSTVVTTPLGSRVDGLVTAAARTWAVVETTAHDHAVPATLEATDGSHDTVALPRGFAPAAGWRGLVVGAYAEGGPIQVFDIAKGAIVDQFGGGAAQFRVGDGTVLWTPPCGAGCQAVRVDLATGKEVGTFDIPPLGGEFGWAALSPDGTRLAVWVPIDAPGSTVGGTGTGTGTAGPDIGYGFATGFRLVVVDLHGGTSSPVLGFETPWPMDAGVTFSPDSKWLILGVATPAGGRIVLYDQNLNGPFLVNATLPGLAGPLVVRSGH